MGMGNSKDSELTFVQDGAYYNPQMTNLYVHMMQRAIETKMFQEFHSNVATWQAWINEEIEPGRQRGLTTINLN